MGSEDACVTNTESFLQAEAAGAPEGPAEAMIGGWGIMETDEQNERDPACWSCW